MRASLEQAWKTFGKKPPELDGPGLPAGLEYLWQYYITLCSSERLTYTELRNWAEMTHIELSGWEVDTIMSVEHEYRRVFRKDDTSTAMERALRRVFK